MEMLIKKWFLLGCGFVTGISSIGVMLLSESYVGPRLYDLIGSLWVISPMLVTIIGALCIGIGGGYKKGFESKPERVVGELVLGYLIGWGIVMAVMLCIVILTVILTVSFH